MSAGSGGGDLPLYLEKSARMSCGVRGGHGVVDLNIQLMTGCDTFDILSCNWQALLKYPNAWFWSSYAYLKFVGPSYTRLPDSPLLADGAVIVIAGHGWLVEGTSDVSTYSAVKSDSALRPAAKMIQHPTCSVAKICATICHVKIDGAGGIGVAHDALKCPHHQVRGCVGHDLTPVRDPASIEFAAEGCRFARWVHALLGSKCSLQRFIQIIAQTQFLDAHVSKSYLHVGTRPKINNGEDLVAREAAYLDDIGWVSRVDERLLAQGCPERGQQVAQVAAIQSLLGCMNFAKIHKVL